jgi:ribose transport system substrate-binding protein
MNVRSLWLVALVLAAVVGCGSSDKVETGKGGGGKAGGKTGKRIVFLTNGDDPFWDTCRAGWMEAAKEMKLEDEAGIVADYQKNDGGIDGQINRLRQYGTESDIVGLAISAVQADSTALTREMEKLQKAGVKVITVDGDVNREKFRSARAYYLGTDNVTGGKVLGTATKAILEARDKKTGGYAQFAGYVDNDNARSRMDGFKEAIGESYKEFDRVPDEMDRKKARDNVRTAIDNYDKDGLVALVGIWAYDGPAVADVVSERKVRDKYAVVTFDAAEDSIAKMGEGNLDLMVVQNPFEMGGKAVKLLKAMLDNDETTIKEMFPKAKGEEDADIHTTGLRVVVPSADSPVKAELFDAKTVEFMELPKFKDWLKKYDLKSS